MSRDASKSLKAARRATEEGRYEDALNEHLWFHEHALESDRSYYGVRLSFALSDWVELGEVYPEARHALIGVRDRKTQQLLAGSGNFYLFHDVESINEYLNDERTTYTLFQSLLTTQPALAKSCSRLAMEAILASKDYTLARRFLAPDPLESLRELAEGLKEKQACFEDKREHAQYEEIQKSLTRSYVKDVIQIMEILIGTGEADEAERVRKAATQGVAFPVACEFIDAALLKWQQSHNAAK